MSTSNPRVWLIGGVIGALLLAILGWTLVINPRMEAVAQTKEETIELDDQALIIAAQARRLQEQAEDLPAQIAALKRIQKRIPASVDVPALLRDIQRTARVNDVTLDSLTPGQITVFSATEEAAQATDPADPQATPDATQPAPQPSPTDLGQGRLPAGMSLSYVPVEMVATGSFADVEAFISRIENLRRAYLITGVQVSRSTATDAKADADNPLSLTLATRVFVANDRLRDLPDQALRQLREEEQ